MTRGLLNNQT
jgi:hypothetical protein